MSGEHSKLLLQGETEGVKTIVILPPEIPPESAQELYDVANSLAGQDGPKQVVLNFDRVNALKSAAIAILIQFQKRVRDAGGELKLCRLHPDIRRLLSLTRADELFDIHERQREAVDAFLGRAQPRAGGLGGWLAGLLGRRG
jgi:anti-anti-sigma factor